MKRKIVTLSLLTLAAVVAVSAVAFRWNSVRAGSGPSANGSGQLVLPSGVKRQFSFSATTKADGTVTGNAEIHNPDFDFRSHIDVQCLLVDGNRASFGGVVRGNDPALNGQNGFFTVYDNGEPGKGKDTVSLIFFANPPGPEACKFIGPDDFPQMPITAGNVQVRQ
jgi:hypothetical protein